MACGEEFVRAHGRSPKEGATDLISCTKRCNGRTLLEEDSVQSAPLGVMRRREVQTLPGQGMFRLSSSSWLLLILLHLRVSIRATHWLHMCNPKHLSPYAPEDMVHMTRVRYTAAVSMTAPVLILALMC